ncbi:hypothetical protein [Methylobacterium komagatae]
MLKAIIAAARHIAAVMAAVTLVPVVEAGRVVWRLVRNVFAPEPPVAAAEAELAHELAQPVEQEPSPAEAWGRAAMLYMAGDAHEAAGTIDDAARAYLDGLSVDQQVALSKHDASVIGAHLLGERHLETLPRPMTPAEFRAIETARAAAAAAEAHQRLVGDDEKRRHFIAVLDDLLAEPPRAA